MSREHVRRTCWVNMSRVRIVPSALPPILQNNSKITTIRPPYPSPTHPCHYQFIRSHCPHKNNPIHKRQPPNVHSQSFSFLIEPQHFASRIPPPHPLKHAAFTKNISGSMCTMASLSWYKHQTSVKLKWNYRTTPCSFSVISMKLQWHYSSVFPSAM